MFRAFIGYDTRMPLAFGVCAKTLNNFGIKAEPLLLPLLEAQGLYKRPTIRQDETLFDVISGFPMATEFALSRFLIPYLCNYEGWALFCDSDFMFLDDPRELCSLIDDKYAVMCVKHDYNPPESIKMDNQVQTKYNRKNWSSFMLINCEHEKNKFLTLDAVNSLAGRYLHAFSWLDDKDIGGLPIEWNWLEGHCSKDIKPKAVHHTRGTPDMVGYENVDYADEWREIAKGLEICKLVN